MAHRTTPTDLENRLVGFASSVLDYTATLPKTPNGAYLADQLSRACLGAALNYGEARAAESPRDFAHKMQIVLKELREAHIAMKITRTKAMGNQSLLIAIMDEANQLISIFVASVKKVKTNRR